MELDQKQAIMNGIVKPIMKTYQEQIHEYLSSQPPGSLTDADVIIMIMNTIMTVSTNMFYSLKQILPNAPVDYDYLRAAIINNLKDSFAGAKDYKPQDTMMPLTVDQVKEIMEKGFFDLKLPDGSIKKITKDDLLVNKDDADKLLDENKKNSVNAVPPPVEPNRIILPGNRSFRR